MPRYLIHLAFDGTAYHGWQVQENAYSVQGVLDDRLSQIFAIKTESMGCGRTDTGVHSSNFFAHFDGKSQYDEKTIAFKLNRMLPKDIVVFKVVQVPDGFHCRFDATSRTYRYFILKNRNPFLADYAWHCHLKLAIEQMNAAAQLLLKFEDFSAFSKGRTQVKTNICHISKAHWMETETMYVFEISADRFLRNMVRAIVGTLMQVGLGKLNQGEFEQIIASKSRTKASDSVPGCGLFLTNVSYPNFLLMDLGIAYKEIPFSITG